jgi:hypothetical protein
MRFAYTILASLEEPLEFFIIRKMSVHHYRSYEVALEGPTIAS